MITLTPVQRRELRARAHALHPVVAIGHAGLSPAVLHEIDVALAAHELIKVRVHSDDRDEREAHLAGICEALEAAPVQHLGKLLILWRPAPEPEPKAKPAAKRGKPAKPAARRRAPPQPAARARRDGPPVPSIGGHAASHRRGAARHGTGGRGFAPPPAPSARGPRTVETAPAADRSRRRLAAKPAPVGDARPRPPFAAKRPPPGAGRQPAGAKRPPPGAGRQPAGAKRPPPGAKRPPAGAKRPSSGARRPPATAKRGPGAGPPSAVKRRRRPTGGR